MLKIIKKHWPVIVAVGAFWGTLLTLIIFVLIVNNGRFTYTLDDAYIHMAIAKNFTLHGVWGVTRYGFSSSGSSLLWPLLLSFVYLLFGVNEFAPLILNIIFATGIIYLLYVILKKYQMSSFPCLITLLCIIFLAHLPSLVITGMEHSLHIFITVAFVYLAADELSNCHIGENGLSLSMKLLLLASPLLIMARYEGMALLLIVCVLFMLHKRYLQTLLLGGIGIAPIIIYGLISVSKGWYILPNSILLKGRLEYLSARSIYELLRYIFKDNVEKNIHILSLYFVLYLASLAGYYIWYIRKKEKQRDFFLMLVISIPAFLLHILFARSYPRQFIRYEAYLVVLGIFIIAKMLNDYFSMDFQSGISNPKLRSKTGKRVHRHNPQRLKSGGNPTMPKQSLLNATGYRKTLIVKFITAAMVIIFFLKPLISQAWYSLLLTPAAASNIYRQQYLMGLFLRKFYQGKGVAANDIGAINYLADINVLDLAGLANMKVAEALLKKNFDTKRIYDLGVINKIKIAIVYDSWYKAFGGVPPQWFKTGELEISSNVVCADKVVSFYAVDPAEADNLINNFMAFQRQIGAAGGTL